jgi:hypothetical protein
MEDFKKIEIEIADKYGAKKRGTRKSIGDFLVNDDTSKPVNVKSNNVEKSNYSPNIISAKRLLNWLKIDKNEIYFIFVDYKKTNNGIDIISESGLIPIHQISWDCLTIESQGWGVIQMNKKLKIDKNQTLEKFLSGLRLNYEKYLEKERIKSLKILEMIKDF